MEGHKSLLSADRLVNRKGMKNATEAKYRHHDLSSWMINYGCAIRGYLFCRLIFCFFMASNAYDIQMVNTEKLQADIKKKQKKVKVKCTCDHLKHWV